MSSEHVVQAKKRPNGSVTYMVVNADGPVAVPQRTYNGKNVQFHDVPEDWPRRYEMPKAHALAYAFWMNDDGKLPRQVADSADVFGGFGE